MLWQCFKQLFHHYFYFIIIFLFIFIISFILIYLMKFLKQNLLILLVYFAHMCFGANLLAYNFNPLFQTGMREITTPTTTTTSFIITLSQPMTTSTYTSGLTVVSSDFSMVGNTFGWLVSILSHNSTSIMVEVQNYYSANSINYLKILYIVNQHPLIDIDYSFLTFQSSDDIDNVNKFDAIFSNSNCPVDCRSTDQILFYQNAKLTSANIEVRAFLIGFKVQNIQVIPGSTNTDVFGVQLKQNNILTDKFTLSIFTYGWSEIKSIALYYISYEKGTINALPLFGISSAKNSLGCGFTYFGCVDISTMNPNSNTSFTSSNTLTSNPPSQLYVIGLNAFRFLYNGDSSTTGTFNLSVSTSGTKYSINFKFLGNSDTYFNIAYNHLYFLQYYCDPAGPAPYLQLSKTSCDSTCNSSIKQYADSNNECQLCNNLCYQCFGGPDICTNCYTTGQNRILSGNQCVCNPLGYYDDNINIVCPSCHYSCRQCYDSLNSSCKNCESTDFRGFNVNSCPCLDGYFDNGASTCQACHYACQTCFGSSWNNCYTCDSLNHRTITTDNRCPCDIGYYTPNAAICQKCHHSCYTCSNSNSNGCTSCNQTVDFRKPLSSNQCLCQDGYYDNNLTSTCQKCHPTCLTCNGPLASNCLTCDTATLNRKLQSGYCYCMSQFYQLSGLCYPCDYSCYNCTANTKTSCLNCDNSNTYRFLTNGQCLCISGYVDKGSQVCIKCNYTCKTCSVIQNNCTTCQASNFRQQNGNTCPCKYGYVDQLLQPLCLPCHYSCQTCSGTADNQCLSCNNTIRIPVLGKCLCFDGTYDDGISQNCQPCNTKCLTCDGQYSNNCLSCDPLLFRSLYSFTLPTFCACNTGYFDSGSLICSPCHITCQTCDMSSTNCTTCDQTNDFRKITSSFTCQCKDGYYQANTKICPSCISTCQTCYSQPDNCTSCNSFRTLINNACLCKNGTYQDSSFTCQPCHYMCSTCQNSSTTCLSCASSSYRLLISSSCPCKDGYYDNSTLLCLKCPLGCALCSPPAPNPICTSCVFGSGRQLNGGACTCPSKYFDDGVSIICQACGPYCENCTSLTICTSCQAAQYRNLILNQCKCNLGYYDNGVSYICQPCHYSCLTCTNGSNNSCLTCQANRNYTSFSCPCKDGYYQILKTCQACNSLCKTCTIDSNICLSCYSGRYLLNNKCYCNNGTFQNGGSCIQCDIKCATCQNSSTSCLSCNNSQFTILQGNACQCPNGKFLNLTSSICQICQNTCLTCHGGTYLDCDSCNSTKNRIFSSGQCLCKDGYYQNTNKQCVICNHLCQTCFGPTVLNCSSCYTGYNLIVSQCKKIITCSNYLYEGICINQCPLSTYPLANQCKDCINNCRTCTSAIYCLSCKQGYYFHQSSHTCQENCLTSQYISDNTCQDCPSQCSTCLLHPTNNQIVCTKCLVGSYFINFTKCVSNCPSLTYVAYGIHCIKCLQHCENCVNISKGGCTLCSSQYYLFEGNCLKQCPQTYYAVNNICFKCQNNCYSCIQNECSKCIEGYYLKNGKCIPNNYFIENQQLVKCHPNCLSCTNSSFSSCIYCNKGRGDTSHMAFKGYCSCFYGSIDTGDGKCDTKSYIAIKKSNQALISLTSVANFIHLIASAICLNILPTTSFAFYSQLYSSMYYLNESSVLQIDSILQETALFDPTNFLNKNKQSARLLTSTQTVQSLYFRNDRFNQFLQWGLYLLIGTILIWTFNLLLLCFINAYWGVQEKQQIRQKSKIEKAFKKIQRYGHQSITIVVFTLTMTVFTLFAAASFKVFFQQDSENKDIPSFIVLTFLSLYYVAYLLRLLIGCIRLKAIDNTNLFIIFYLYRHTATTIFHRLYFPLWLLRNMIAAILLISLSYNPKYQIISIIVVCTIFFIYELIFCPFEVPYRILMSLINLVLLIQLAIFAYSFFLPESSRLLPAYFLLSMNFVQIFVIILFSLVVIIKKLYLLCQPNIVTNQNLPKNEISQVNLSQQFNDSYFNDFCKVNQNFKAQKQSQQQVDNDLKSSTLKPRDMQQVQAAGHFVKIDTHQLFKNSKEDSQFNEDKDEIEIPKQQVVVKRYKIKNNQQRLNDLN